jgi:uncharacterized protein (TIGR03083 family)
VDRGRAAAPRAVTVRPDIVFVLAGECAQVSDVVLGLEEPQFALATRCPPWDVKGLLGHLWRDVDRIASSLTEPPAAEATNDAVSYFRSYDPVAEGPAITQRSLEVAALFAAGADLARSFDEHWRACLEAARSEEPGRLLQTRLTGIRLDDFCATRVLEVAVHGMDLADALGRGPWITPAGAEVTTGILRSLLGADPPPGWDERTFIEIATGRRALGDEDRAALGNLAVRIPLLG